MAFWGAASRRHFICTWSAELSMLTEHSVEKMPVLWRGGFRNFAFVSGNCAISDCDFYREQNHDHHYHQHQSIRNGHLFFVSKNFHIPSYGPQNTWSLSFTNFILPALWGVEQSNPNEIMSSLHHPITFNSSCCVLGNSRPPTQSSVSQSCGLLALNVY